MEASAKEDKEGEVMTVDEYIQRSENGEPGYEPIWA